MKIFYIEAKVTIRVEGISGPWEPTVLHLVRANDLNSAKAKFESQVKKDNERMMAKSFVFEYLKIGTEI
jgi:hypothetical protein